MEEYMMAVTPRVATKKTESSKQKRYGEESDDDNCNLLNSMDSMQKSDYNMPLAGEETPREFAAARKTLELKMNLITEEQ